MLLSWNDDTDALELLARGITRVMEQENEK